jgi:hypothetical protein
MSYFSANAIQPTPGLAFEAFENGVSSPMFPHAPYRKHAAGPAYLDAEGVGSYWGYEPSVPSNLRGLGVDLDLSSLTQQIGAGVEQKLDQIVQGIINRNWPLLEQKLDKSMLPIKIMLGLGLAASTSAAVLAYLNYQKTS